MPKKGRPVVARPPPAAELMKRAFASGTAGDSGATSTDHWRFNSKVHFNSKQINQLRSFSTSTQIPVRFNTKETLHSKEQVQIGP
jgi:hypothetical protein